MVLRRAQTYAGKVGGGEGGVEPPFSPRGGTTPDTMVRTPDDRTTSMSEPDAIKRVGTANPRQQVGRQVEDESKDKDEIEAERKKARRKELRRATFRTKGREGR